MGSFTNADNLHALFVALVTLSGGASQPGLTFLLIMISLSGLCLHLLPFCKIQIVKMHLLTHQHQHPPHALHSQCEKNTRPRFIFPFSSFFFHFSPLISSPLENVHYSINCKYEQKMRHKQPFLPPVRTSNLSS